MSSTLQTLISLLAIILALGAPARGQEDATSFTYDFYGGTPPNTLSLQGNAHFATDTTFLRMTSTGTSGNALQYSAGRAVHSAPIKFWEAGAQVDLETTFKFIIRPNPGDNNPADGFAFFIIPVGAPVGFTGGSFGVFDTNGVKDGAFAAELDIFSNPGVDPTYRHIGIDIESNVSKNTTDVGPSFLLGQEVTAVVSYKQDTKLIKLTATAGGQTFEVSYVFDLSTVLPQTVQVGISATTGGQVAVHELISWYYSSTLVRYNANCNLRNLNCNLGGGGSRQYA